MDSTHRAPRASLLVRPLYTLSLFAEAASESVVEFATFLSSRRYTVALSLALIAAVIQFLQHAPDAAAPYLYELKFVIYWFVLGVLSSIGLGSGLHTFVLYLAPHIVRVTAAATAARSVDFSARISRFVALPPPSWDVAGVSTALSPTYAHDAWVASAPSAASMSAGALHFAIFSKVSFAALVWGAGTAVGEFPPYFVARAAARAGRSIDEVEEARALTVARAASRPAAVRSSSVPTAPSFLRLPQRFADAVRGALRRSSSTDTRATRTPTVGVGGSGDVAARTAAGGESSPRASLILQSPANRVTASAKAMMFGSVQRFGFWAIFALASFPNPLFDLVGLTCGHFGVHFYTFATATFLGKAVVKASLQAHAIILVFALAPHLIAGARVLSIYAPWVDAAEATLALQQSSLCAGAGAACASCCTHMLSKDTCAAGCAAPDAPRAAAPPPSTLATIWGYAVLCMVLAFLGSLVTSVAQGALERRLARAAAAAKQQLPPVTPPRPRIPPLQLPQISAASPREGDVPGAATSSASSDGTL